MLLLFSKLIQTDKIEHEVIVYFRDDVLVDELRYELKEWLESAIARCLKLPLLRRLKEWRLCGSASSEIKVQLGRINKEDARADLDEVVKPLTELHICIRLLKINELEAALGLDNRGSPRVRRALEVCSPLALEVLELFRGH